MLADRVGLQMPEQGVDDSMSRLRQRVLEINRESARFFHSALLSPEGKPGLDYFARAPAHENDPPFRARAGRRKAALRSSITCAPRAIPSAR